MALLSVEGLSVVYGGIDAVADVSLDVGEGDMVALLGANGAGKSTVLKAISGVLDFERGTVTAGDIRFDGASILGTRAHRRARAGLIHVREGRHVLPSMTVEENLRVAGFALSGRGAFPGRREIEAAYDWFPGLADRRQSLAGYLSGGEQQQLAIARALVARPRLVLVDEASLGLAPLIAEEIFRILGRVNIETGLSILVVEQNIGLALRHAAHAYVLENGRVALQGPPAAIGDRQMLSARYLGGDAAPA